jgi:PAS domain S-box-containing protein
MVRRTVGPLLSGIRAFAAGSLGHRLRLDARTAEVHELGWAFDEMADRLSSTLVSRDALEATVEARTAELTRAVDAGIRMQEALAEREERVRLLLESTAEAIYGVDLSGRCTFANPASARLLGWASAAELVGKQLHGLVHHSLPDGTPLPAERCTILHALREGREYHAADETFWRPDRTPISVEVWSHPVVREGALIGGVVTFLDVSERRRLEAELLNVKKLESLGVLAGGIAHDFNNLLTGVLGNLSIVSEQLPAGGEPAELVEEAQEAARRARGLTQQLLTFSKGGQPVRKVLAPAQIVEDAMTFALRGSAVRGRLSVAEGLWSVEADAGQLAQVIQNLVLNGGQAMPRGGALSITCDNVELPAASGMPLPAGRYVRISVADEGTGIAPELMPRIFDPYFTTRQTGSGLGLATVYAIVKKHGGHVAARSRLGAGTAFDVWLPATSRLPAPAPARPAAAARRRGLVLVMDDEPIVRSAVTGMLAALGYETIVAADGLEAERMFEEERRAGRAVAAVLLDLTVPGGVGGVAALARLRSLEPSVRAVATSGYSNDPVMADPSRYGFAGVLPKPYTLDDLARAIADALDPAGAAS